jgi:hypothetical protein
MSWTPPLGLISCKGERKQDEGKTGGDFAEH